MVEGAKGGLRRQGCDGNWGGAVGGAIGLDNLIGLEGKGGKDVVHVSIGREEEVAVLADFDEHVAGDSPLCSLVLHPELCLLLSVGDPRRLEGGEEDIPSYLNSENHYGGPAALDSRSIERWVGWTIFEVTIAGASCGL